MLTKSRKVKSRIAARYQAQRQRTPFERNIVEEKAARSQENHKRNLFTKEKKDNLKYIDPSIIAMAAYVSRLKKMLYRILDPDSPSNDGPAKAGQTENKGSPAHSIHCDSEEDGEEAIDNGISNRCVRAKRRSINKEDLRKATINKTIPTIIADSGASSTCVKKGKKEQVSECGDYKWTGHPYDPTDEESDKVFSMALGHTAEGGEVVDLHLPLRQKARRGHTVEGITNSLLSMGKLAENEYIPILDNNEINIYDSRNTQITVSRGAVLTGYWVPSEGLWRIPLIKGKKIVNKNMETIATDKCPMTLLQNTSQPPTNHILNAYEIKKQPELIAYYHAAAGFPTKPTWIAAIKNGHYKSWKRLTVAAV